MSSLPALSNLSGKWRGKNLLWLSPDEMVRESEAFLAVDISCSPSS